MSNRILMIMICAAGAPLVTQAQPEVTKPAAFEVASIRPNVGGSGGGVRTSHGAFTATNISAKILIQSAFGVRDFQIDGGPGWLAVERYDVAAKTETPIDRSDEYKAPLQALLADRFGLKFHRETRELAAYALVVAKGGPKLTEFKGEGGDGMTTKSVSGKASLTAARLTMAKLSDALSRMVERTVVDNTRLNGEFSVKLEWSDGLADSSGPSLFTALQEQLGLRLESTKAPVEMIVIDHLERPSEN